MVIDRDFPARWKNRSDRWSIVKEFLVEWRTPLAPGDGLSEDAILGMGPLPLALREWYALAGRRRDLVAAQNDLRIPPETNPDDDYRIVLSENQWVVVWGVAGDDWKLPDPPVWIRHAVKEGRTWGTIDRWDRQNATLSEFIFQMLILETCLGIGRPEDEPPHFVHLRPQDIRWLEENCYSPGFPDWIWPAEPTRILATDGVLITATLHEDYPEAFVSAIDPNALERIGSVLKFESY